MIEINEKIQKAREYSAQHAQKPEVKETRRIASLFRAHRSTLATTMRRIQSHTFDDLVEIARMCCQDDPSRFETNKDAIRIAMAAIRRRAENVQNNLALDNISELQLSD